MEKDVEKGTTASAANNGISNPLWNHDHHSTATGGHGHEHEHTNNTSSNHDHNHEHTNTAGNFHGHSHEHHASIGCTSDHGHAHEHTHDEKQTSPLDSDSAHHGHDHDHTSVSALGDGHDHSHDHDHGHDSHDSHSTVGNDSSLDHPVTTSSSLPSKHTRDNNFRAAFLHVVMDAFVSVLVIIALVVARFVVLLHVTVTTLFLSIGFATF